VAAEPQDPRPGTRPSEATAPDGTAGAAPTRPTISTHVLDTERGIAAVGVHVTLYRLDVGVKPIRMTQALTDADGRVRDLLERPLAAGDYRLEFDVAHEDVTFFTKLSVELRITDTTRSYHVPLLLAPYSMTTYRGT
jgi:5-hydroxyisourate hydrolase